MQFLPDGSMWPAVSVKWTWICLLGNSDGYRAKSSGALAKRHGMERGRSLTLLTTDARNHFGVLQRRIRAGGEGKE